MHIIGRRAGGPAGELAGGWLGLVTYTLPDKGGREGSGACILLPSPSPVCSLRMHIV